MCQGAGRGQAESPQEAGETRARSLGPLGSKSAWDLVLSCAAQTKCYVGGQETGGLGVEGKHSEQGGF